MCKCDPMCSPPQAPEFYLYALYNKNKPKSDAMLAEFGKTFFKVSIYTRNIAHADRHGIGDLFSYKENN